MTCTTVHARPALGAARHAGRRCRFLGMCCLYSVAILGLDLGWCVPAGAAPFTAVDRERDFTADIVLRHDAETGRGHDWTALTAPRSATSGPERRLREALDFLHEGIARLTERTPTIRSGTDTDGCIVVTLLRDAPADVAADPRVREALANDGSDAYNDREAFYLRSDPNRLLIVANTSDGLVAAMPALLETVGYEVLAMGPNWTHVPKEHRQRLTFDVEFADRPSYYLRELGATSGQGGGVGTLQVGPKLQLADPADESVGTSYARWRIGARLRGRSMPSFPGHAMYQYHRTLAAEMVRTGSTIGFLTPATHLGLDADRPAADLATKGHLWLNTDPPQTPGHAKAFVSDGVRWKEQNPYGYSVKLDPTAPLPRGIVLEALKKQAAAHFKALDDDPHSIDEPLIFGTESEDGSGLAKIAEWSAPEHRNWYVDYLRAEGVAYPQPYVLHGERGIDQPREAWDIATPSDTVFGFNNWLLREFDRWIDSLPEAERTTKRGTAKKSLVRCSLYSYGFHDVPPHINLDPRIRVMIAGYPKHRGLGTWKAFPRQQDVAAAFRIMLPHEPSGEYRIPSHAYYADYNLEGIPARWSASPERLVAEWKGRYDAGIRAVACETDFNFGKYGLAYYLISRLMWNTRLSPTELDAVRDRWLQRAYGPAWQEMKRYYDFMLADHFTVNAPANWAKAVRLIDAASAKLDPVREPDARRRLDDLKQYWYFYYLIDSGAMERKTPELVEFLWKGQMSYATAMHMVLKRAFDERSVAAVVPAEWRRGPAHYTTEETAAWWRKVLDHWPTVEVSQFADAVLADGRRGGDVDLNDLVPIADFAAMATGKPFAFNSAQAPPTIVVTAARAGRPIGFRFGWPAKDDQERFFGPHDVPYGIEWWDAESRQWTPVVDETTTTAPSRVLETRPDGQRRHVVDVELPAPRDGTYRIEVGRGGFLAQLASLGYDFADAAYRTRPPFCFTGRPSGLTQDPVSIYLPKGTPSLDLETWDATGKKSVTLHTGVTEKGLVKSRTIDIGSRGTHRIPLEPSETGHVAQIAGHGCTVPLLYSVPQVWAKCPAELLVPRAVAEADGLQIAE